MKPEQSVDKPLSGAANFLLQVGAAVSILLCYFFVFVSILVLLLVLLIEMTLFVAMARFGVARLMTPLIHRHGGLLLIFVRSLWLGKSAEFQVPLSPLEAPGLFRLLGGVCEKAKVPLPKKIQLQMGVTAWVRMKGYRRGAGTTILGMGYDLLAGLTQVEVEGVLAHEMMHAKLVQRGFRQVLNKGLSRAVKLTQSLTTQVATVRRAKKSVIFSKIFQDIADFLTRLAARQIAACSRQDEFQADIGAAELCGAGALRSSLLKLESLERIASRISLRDRIAQLESEESFSEWFIREVASIRAQGESDVQAAVFNPYSTHPSLHDRLAALAKFPDQTCESSPPALQLLSHPDKVAASLVEMIQKQLAAQEEEDSRRLNLLSRKMRVRRHMGSMRIVGFGFFIFGAISFIACFEMASTWGIFQSLAAVALGITLFFFFGRYKEEIALPVPDYALIKAAAQKKPDLRKEIIDSIERELRQKSGQIKAGARRAAFFIQQSYEALGLCDYLRAHIAARFCLEQQKKSIPGHLALAIAAGALKQHQQVGMALRFVQHRTGMRGASTAWGAGWALTLVSDWIYAEIFLKQACGSQPLNPTLHALLAIAQLRRGKLFNAISSARKANELRPQEIVYTKLLVDLLLQGGFLREANQFLQQLSEEVMTDSELIMAMITFCLSRRNLPDAEQWMKVISQNDDNPAKFVRLGQMCENARYDQRAAEFFQQALTYGHYPEALFGLGCLEVHQQNHPQARAYFLSALDLERPAAEHSSGTMPLVVPILQRLRTLENPVSNCRAWIAKLSTDIKTQALANVSFIVYAPTDREARQVFTSILQAMLPHSPSPSVHWKPAPKEHQPDVPVPSGVLHFVE